MGLTIGIVSVVVVAGGCCFAIRWRWRRRKAAYKAALDRANRDAAEARRRETQARRRETRARADAASATNQAIALSSVVGGQPVVYEWKDGYGNYNAYDEATQRKLRLAEASNKTEVHFSVGHTLGEGNKYVIKLSAHKITQKNIKYGTEREVRKRTLIFSAKQ